MGSAGDAGFCPLCTPTPSGPSATAGSARRLQTRQIPAERSSGGTAALAPCWNAPQRAEGPESFNVQGKLLAALFLCQLQSSPHPKTDRTPSARGRRSQCPRHHTCGAGRTRELPESHNLPAEPGSLRTPPPGSARTAPSAGPHSPCWPHGRRGAARRRTASEPTAERRREVR